MRKVLKVLVGLLLLAQAVESMAHRDQRCRSRTNHNGRTVTTCRDVAHSHRHHRDEDYSDGFFDGMVSSSALFLSTADIFDGDEKKDFIQSELAMALATVEEGKKPIYSSTLEELLTKVRKDNKHIEGLTDGEIMDSILVSRPPRDDD